MLNKVKIIYRCRFPKEYTKIFADILQLKDSDYKPYIVAFVRGEVATTANLTEEEKIILTLAIPNISFYT